MSKRLVLAEQNYQWNKGTVLRNAHTSVWWLGYKAARSGLSNSPPRGMVWSTEEIAAFESGYEYRKETYGYEGQSYYS